MSTPLVGVLGGTFDPIHLGHRQLAADAIEALQLDSLRCIPAGQPPHRQSPVANAAQRLAMTQLALADLPRCVVDDGEIRQNGPSWTIRTLERLRLDLPDSALVLIVGADAFLGLPGWHRWQGLLDYAHIAVANRPGAALAPEALPMPLAALWQARHSTQLDNLKQQRAGRLLSFTITPCPVSATQIRQLAAQGASVDALLAPAVAHYIRQHHLYAPIH